MSQKLKANLFNLFFESVYAKGCKSPYLNSIPHSGCQNTLNITDTDVYTVLSNFDTTKACMWHRWHWSTNALL